MERVFAKRLRELRQEKKLSQVDLGALLGYGYTAISNYENGRNEPSLSDFIRICEVLEVSADYILGLSDIRRPCAIVERSEVIQLYNQAVRLATSCRKCL